MDEAEDSHDLAYDRESEESFDGARELQAGSGLLNLGEGRSRTGSEATTQSATIEGIKISYFLPDLTFCRRNLPLH